MNMMQLLGFCMLLILPVAVCAENIVFPDDAGHVDVTKPPYSLQGDGKTDNTPALQKAFLDLRGSNKTLYFPDGTYLFSDRVSISGDEPAMPHSPTRFLHLQGQSEKGTILRLKDNAPGYDDPAKPKTFISLYEGKSTGDMMHEYVRNMTFEIGAGNPGAAALRYLTNNSGAMYDVTIRSLDPERRGAIGLDLRQSQQGPGLIKRVTIEGFDRGIEVGNSFSMVFEHITLRNQRQAGWVNNNARTTIRNLVSENSVPAIDNGKHGQITLIEGTFSGGGSDQPAVLSESNYLFLRDVKVDGYGSAVRFKDGKAYEGALDEWHAGQAYGLFDNQKKTLRLPIEETPEIPWETDLSKWVKVEPGEDTLQAAIDEAAGQKKTTIYFPKLGGKNAEYVLTRPVRVHGSVNRIIGMESILRVDEKIPPGQAVLILEDLDGPIVIERFFNILVRGGWKGMRDRYLIDYRTDHPIIIRNLAKGATTLKKPTPGKTWFIEDVPTIINVGKGEKVWARQLNPESPDAEMVTVEGGQVWILGLKTEGRATHIVAKDGAQVESLGGVSYQSWGKQPLDPPMFLIENSAVAVVIGMYADKLPFTTIAQETHKGTTRTLSRKDVKGSFMALYRSAVDAQPETGSARR
jgi:hypothetical protein